ncbi:MAG: hypothetical protein WBD09_00780 [Halobacteriota archaeon]
MSMKNVVGVAAVITVVMAIVLIAFSSTASASLINRTFTPSGGNITYEGDFGSKASKEPAKNILLVYNWKDGDKTGGEKIKFKTNGSFDMYVEGPYTKEGEQSSGYDLERESVSAVWDAEGKKTNGYFKVWEKDNENIGGWFQVVKHEIKLELEGEKKKVQEKECFNLTLKSNGRDEGVMKLTIEDDDGYSIMNETGTDIYEILIEYKNGTEFFDFSTNLSQTPVGGISFTEDKKLVFNTSELDMEKGKYKIILEDYATEAETKVNIEVEKIYLEVECDDEVVKGEDVVIIIKSSFYEKNVNVTVAGIPETIPPLTLDEEGKKKVKIPTEDMDYGTYKVTVEVCDITETKYVKVKKSGTSLEEVPENATVGDIIAISGTSDCGDFAVFLVDDVFKNEARISDGEFEWDWDTSGEFDDYREIEVFIVSEHVSFSIGEHVSEDWQREKGVEASATIFLLLPTFCMTAPKNIAKGDDVVISGNATGTDHVYVIVINYKGEVTFPANGIASTTPVEEGDWAENLGELDSGTYAVISMHEGKDGITDAINDDEWVIGDKGKTLEQRVAILEDALSSAGSDDLFVLAYFSVSTPKVRLAVPVTVEIGTAISVNAETNIKSGENAFVSLSFNSSILKKISVLVENGSVNASINTSGLQPGTYNVAVDVRGRASDENTVLLVEKEAEEVQEQEGKDEEESIPQNESLTEPEAVDVEKAVESAGELKESLEGEEREIPVSVCDLLIAVIVAVSISIAMKRRSR